MKGAMLDIGEVIPCGIVVNELVANAIEHAFAGVEGERRIDSHLGKSEGGHTLRVADNGIGLAGAGDGFRIDFAGNP